MALHCSQSIVKWVAFSSSYHWVTVTLKTVHYFKIQFVILPLSGIMWSVSMAILQLCGRFGSDPPSVAFEMQCGRFGSDPPSVAVLTKCNVAVLVVIHPLWPFWPMQCGRFGCGRFGSKKFCGRFGCGRFGVWPFWPGSNKHAMFS